MQSTSSKSLIPDFHDASQTISTNCPKVSLRPMSSLFGNPKFSVEISELIHGGTVFEILLIDSKTKRNLDDLELVFYIALSFFFQFPSSVLSQHFSISVCDSGTQCFHTHREMVKILLNKFSFSV